MKRVSVAKGAQTIEPKPTSNINVKARFLAT